MIPARWSNGNTFTPRTERYRVQFSGKLSKPLHCQRLATAVTFLEKKLRCSSAIDAKMGPLTRHKLRTNQQVWNTEHCLQPTQASYKQSKQSAYQCFIIFVIKIRVITFNQIFRISFQRAWCVYLKAWFVQNEIKRYKTWKSKKRITFIV